MKKFICSVFLCLSLALTACGGSGDVSGISGTYNARYDENNPHEVVALIDASLTFDGAGGAVFEDSKLKLTGTYKQTSGGYEITFEEIEADAALVIGAESLSNQTMTVAVESDGTLTVQESCTHLSFDEAEFDKDGTVSQATVSAPATNDMNNIAPSESAQSVDDIVSAAQQTPESEIVVYSGADFDIVQRPYHYEGYITLYDNGLSGADRRYGFARQGDTGTAPITEAIYDEIGINFRGVFGMESRGFVGEFAAVRAYDEMSGESKWGFIDETGALVVPLKYDEVQDFSGGYALVKLGRSGNVRNDKWGLVDKTGTEVVPVEYSTIQNFDAITDGYVTVGNADGLYGKYDIINNKLVVPIEYDMVGDFSDGLCGVRKTYSSGEGGFIDTEGNLVIERSDFGGGEFFSEGLAVVSIERPNSYTGMPEYVAMFINKNGEQVGDVFQDATPFQNGYSVVQGNDENGGRLFYGYADTSGKLVIPHQFSKAYPFEHGLAVVADSDWVYYLINESGERVSDFNLDTVLEDQNYPFQNGLKKMRANNSWGFIDTAGKLIADGFYETGAIGEELIPVQRQSESKWGYINTQTGETAIPYTLDYAGDFSGGVAFARTADIPDDSMFQALGLIFYPLCLIDSTGTPITGFDYIGVAENPNTGEMSLSQEIAPFKYDKTVVAVSSGEGEFTFVELEIVRK